MKRIIVAAAIAVMACLAFAPDGFAKTAKKPVARPCCPVQALHRGLVDWWPGDESAADVVGYRTGTLKGNARISPGLVGGAFSLDGDGDFVEVPSDSMLDFGEQDFTVSLWVKFSAAGGEQVLIEKWVQKFTSPLASTGWTLTKLQEQAIRLAVSAADTGEIDIDSEPLDIPSNVWLHVAARREQNEFSIYLNGRRVAFEAVDPAVPVDLRSSSSLKIGHRGIPSDTPGSEDLRGGFYLNGQIDEVQLFMGRALPPGLIQAIYLASERGVCKP
jgi:sialidase-1